MPITIPNRTLVKPTTTPLRKPGQVKTGVVNPCPVGVAATGATGTGGALLEPTVTRDNYVGYNVRTDVPQGASADDEAYAPVTGCVVEGFAGVTPGAPVFVDNTARPDPEGTFSGLSHTDGETLGTPGAIGVGWTTTKIYLYAL
jgi:hypothetical protein